MLHPCGDARAAISRPQLWRGHEIASVQQGVTRRFANRTTVCEPERPWMSWASRGAACGPPPAGASSSMRTPPRLRAHWRRRRTVVVDLSVPAPASARSERLGHGDRAARRRGRSEEHTSELQSPCNLVCRLLLEKKKRTRQVQSLSNLVNRLMLEVMKIVRSHDDVSCYRYGIGEYDAYYLGGLCINQVIIRHHVT